MWQKDIVARASTHTTQTKKCGTKRNYITIYLRSWIYETTFFSCCRCRCRHRRRCVIHFLVRLVQVTACFVDIHRCQNYLHIIHCVQHTLCMLALCVKFTIQLGTRTTKYENVKTTHKFHTKYKVLGLCYLISTFHFEQCHATNFEQFRIIFFSEKRHSAKLQILDK